MRSPETDRKACERLAEGISALLIAEQGRGHECSVEYFRRENGLHHFIAWPDDYVQSYHHHDDHGELDTESFMPTFSIVFVFDECEGSLVVSAKINKRYREQLEVLFAKTILDELIGPWVDSAFSLNQLKDRDFELVTEPEDQLAVHIPGFASPFATVVDVSSSTSTDDRTPSTA